MPEIRETNEFVLPVSGKKVVLKGYLTGRIKQELEAIFMRNSIISTKVDEDGKPVSDNTTTMDGDTILEARNKAIELLVVSVDGQSDGVLDRVLDLPEADWKFVREQVDALQYPLAQSSETSSQTATDTPSPKA